MSSKLTYILVFLFFSFSQGCFIDGIDILETEEVGNWLVEEPIVFDNIQLDSDSKLILRVNHSEDYHFENLYIQVVFREHSDILAEDVVSIDLIGSRGQWIGKKFRNGRSVPFDLVTDAIISQDAPISLEIYQYSRQEVLKGINSLSLERRPK